MRRAVVGGELSLGRNPEPDIPLGAHLSRSAARWPIPPLVRLPDGECRELRTRPEYRLCYHAYDAS